MGRVPPSDPFSGGFDPRMFENVPLFRELAKVMSWRGGPVNWELAGQTAQAIAATGDETVTDAERDEFDRAVGTAELWLDEVVGLPAVDGPARPLSQVGWAAQACSSEGLGVYVEPVARGMTTAMTRQLPEELQAVGGASLADQLQPLTAMLSGIQIGTVAGHLAQQLLATYDLGVPTMDPHVVATVGGNARTFATDYGFDHTELLYWIALREAAHRRQFVGVPWLRAQVADLVGRFAAEADFDSGGLMEQLGQLGIDPAQGIGDPESLRAAFEGPDAFRIEPTAAQQVVLGELQALVSFTLAWVDTVVESAAGGRLTALSRIEEAILRRRAEKGAGERFLEQLVGLTLRPADVRAGRAFCAAVIDARGQEGLDRVWTRPEHLPRPAELADASRWLVRMAAAELED
jgi:putative hydrolase